MPSISDLEREVKQFRELSRLFFGRFLDNDLICLEGDTRGTLVGILTLLAAPGIFLPFLEYIQFSSGGFFRSALWIRDLGSLPDKAIHLGLSMSVLGIATVLEWDALLPDRRDCAVLRPLPVRLGTLFAAKIAALVRFFALLTAALGAVSLVLFPMAVLQRGTWDMLIWFIRAHAIAMLAGNAFIFVSMIAAQGVLISALGWRRFRRFAPYAQFVLITALLVMFFFSIGLSFTVSPARPASTMMLACPPIWFVGLYENELSWSQPVFRDLASQARLALAGAGILAAIAYALSYRRTVAKSFEESEEAASAPGQIVLALNSLANRVLLRTPGERAAFYFVRQTLMRSRSHRVLIATYAGVGFALIFQGLAGVMASGSRTWWQDFRGPLLPAPIVLSLFLLSGLRYAFTVPAELRANWAFQVAALGEPREYLAGVRKAAVLLAIVPLFSLLLPIHIAIWGWLTGGIHIFFGATVAYLIMEVLLVGLGKLPFTCSYVPGKANLKEYWPFYVFGYLGYVSLFTGVEFVILRQPSLFILFLVAAGAAKAGIEVYRRRLLGDEYALEFNEKPQPVVTTLELQQ